MTQKRGLEPLFFMSEVRDAQTAGEKKPRLSVVFQALASLQFL
jgi:hypothetical protein